MQIGKENISKPHMSINSVASMLIRKKLKLLDKIINSKLKKILGKLDSLWLALEETMVRLSLEESWPTNTTLPGIPKKDNKKQTCLGQ